MGAVARGLQQLRLRVVAAQLESRRVELRDDDVGARELVEEMCATLELTSLKVTSEPSQLQASACRVLGNLCAEPSLATPVAHVGAIHLVLTAMLALVEELGLMCPA